jgi:tRNA pseudouridine32 synthase/23S rRNA pseudouridine746 synthase
MHRFQADISHIPIPLKFTYPFHYVPHPLAMQAAGQLQAYLQTQQDFEHNFGLTPDDNKMVIGKMFGVLVVQNKVGEIGFLAAFSGKLADSNHHTYFVPPVYDMLEGAGFFLEESKTLNLLNAQIEQLTSSEVYINAVQNLADALKVQTDTLERVKFYMQQQKNNREQLKQTYAGILSEEDLKPLSDYLINQSLKDKFDFKKEQQVQAINVANAQRHFDQHDKQLQALKKERKAKSASLQTLLFEQYKFLNAKDEQKSLQEIFVNGYGIQPPAAAGECAAPKLLQYAYIHNLKPIAMAEFWWGQSPKSAIRKHTTYYPACKSKCEPILTHMLQGLNMMPNPLLSQQNVFSIAIIYEDAHLLVINKPAEFLTVPGIHLQDSVYTRMKKLFPSATGPLIVHRLDQATSGLLIIAKTKEVHALLQHAFIKRNVHKRYEALLNGNLIQNTGIIDLPLRVDLEDRPRQMVCYEHGKSALTKYEVIARTEDHNTRVYFYPVTGRTHQLRVHAAHQQGLNAPIIGDDLYGSSAARLHLHAQQLVFEHPITKQIITLEASTPF